MYQISFLNSISFSNLSLLCYARLQWFLTLWLYIRPLTTLFLRFLPASPPTNGWNSNSFSFSSPLPLSYPIISLNIINFILPYHLQSIQINQFFVRDNVFHIDPHRTLSLVAFLLGSAYRHIGAAWGGVQYNFWRFPPVLRGYPTLFHSTRGYD